MVKLRRALVLALVALVVAVAVVGAQATTYTLPGNAVFPEGIAYEPATGYFYVSSTGDGTVFRARLSDSAATPFLPPGGDGRTSAVGLRAATVMGQNRLYVAGGGTGQMFVYNTANGSLLAKYSNGLAQNTFVNDVVVTPAGDAYFTDSSNPVLYRVPASLGPLESWLNFGGTPIQYGQGVNLNGIVVTADGRYLLTVQLNTGKLYRIQLDNKAITEVNLGGQTLANGDGLLLDGRTLYAVRNRDRLIVVVELAADFASGRVATSFTDASLAFPTTIAKVGDRLLVVNSQFDKAGPPPNPVLPFTVSSVPIPGAAMPGLPSTSGGRAATPSGWLIAAGGLLALLGCGVLGARWTRRWAG